MATFETAYKKVEGLVRDFNANEKTFLAPGYSEAQVRDDFIDDFFIALGWDVTHIHEKNPYRQEVRIEKSVKDEEKRKRRADYAFSLAPNYKNTIFIVEAKKPAKDLLNIDDYFQAIRYATNTNTPIVVLTDFEELHVIDARFKTTIDNALHRKIKEYRYHDYADREKFAEIYYLFSREAVADNSIQEYADSLPIPKTKAGIKTYLPKGKKSVDESLLDELEDIRTVLARAFKKTNPSLDSYELTEATQRTIDRLVFLRFLEDKLIEPELFVSRFALSNSPWQDFTKECIPLNAKYNGVVFRKHFIDDNTFNPPAAAIFIDVCTRLTNPDYYFDVIPIHILGSIYERFLGSVVHATSKRVTVQQKPEVKKAVGVYYTPLYIVDYIIKNTIGKLIEGKSPLQISRLTFADIACGSGSFLISVFGYIMDYISNWYNDNPKIAKQDGCIHIKEDDNWVLSLQQKRKILVNNIYGIDLDEQAVEVTALSLYLKLLEDETTATAHEMTSFFTLLPDLSKNIICGNALIESDILTSGLYSMSDAEERKINPLDSRDVFNDIMTKGGFDAIVGNPPYLSYYSRESVGIDNNTEKYLRTHYDFLEGFSTRARINSVMFFLERYCKLAREEASIGCIIDFNVFEHAFLPIRKYLTEHCAIREILDDIVSFKDVASGQVILLFDNKIDPRNTVLWKKGFRGEQCKIRQSKFNDEKNSYKWEYKQDHNILKKIESAPARLENLVKVITGVAVNASKEGKAQFISDSKRNSKYYPLLEGGYSISHPYAAPKFKSYINYDKNLQNKLNDKFEAWYMREKGSRQRPFNLREFDNFNQPKVFVRQSDVRFTATYSEDLFFGNYSLFTLNDENQSKDKLLYITGLLNSKLLSYYGMEKGIIQVKKGKTPQIRSGQRGPIGLRQVPMEYDEQKRAYQKIVRLVKQMMEAQKKRSDATSDRDNNYYQRRCTSLDREINKEVYKLYDLTEEEIKLIDEQ